MFKNSLNVYDTLFGFYIHFKRGPSVLPYGNHQRKWVNFNDRLKAVVSGPGHES